MPIASAVQGTCEHLRRVKALGIYGVAFSAMFEPVPGDDLANEGFFAGVVCSVDARSKKYRQIKVCWVYTRAYLDALIQKGAPGIHNGDESVSHFLLALSVAS